MTDVTERVIEQRIREAVYAWVLVNEPAVIVEARRLVTEPVSDPTHRQAPSVVV